MKLESIIPREVWISPSVHIRLVSQQSSRLGLLYGAILPSHIQITHFLQYPLLQREHLSNWQKTYQKEFLKNQDTQKLGWYSKGKKERRFEELEMCKNYQKCVPQSFFLMIDCSQQFPYRGFRIKGSFLNRQVFKTTQLDKLEPFYQLNIKIKGVVDLSNDNYLLSKTKSNNSQPESDKIKLIKSYINATIQNKRLPIQNQTMIQQQFTDRLTYKLTEKQYKKRLKQEDIKQNEANELLNDLWEI